MAGERAVRENRGFRLEIGLTAVPSGGAAAIVVRLRDASTDAVLGDGPYVYRAARMEDRGTWIAEGMRDATLRALPDGFEIRGTLETGMTRAMANHVGAVDPLT